MRFSLFRIAWTLLHLLISIVECIKYSLNAFRRKLENLLYGPFVEYEIGSISKRVKLIDKIPSHLVVIIGNESVSYRDLANIIVWCIAAGISFLSFYDYHGILKRNEAELVKVLSEMGKEHIEKIVWGKKTNTNGILNKNGTKNGFKATKKICINIFSLSDGKGSIVELTKSLGQSVLAGHLKTSDIDQELIDKKLLSEFNIPDPELALYCGDTCSTYGFLPWQIRVTEFLHMSTHHKIKMKDFIHILEKYGKCVQRFGK
ncbi:hypothetical protein L9F63_015670 [Diploptera punctata]|uniref:ditrans,polycis-polyprenyl diphosphate synthase [(2E,6E)-farnesyldiphosphate specific] n=1 Tax=Diploptera punctata TaxID=6984 RepID=A0AAD8A4W1_DIPPU|nr:hypothetical protein L9F63_015670 [Diploptera punctata]